MNARTKVITSLATELAKNKLRKGDPRDAKRLIFESFRQLGGVYIKFLQMLAISTDFLEGWAGPREIEVFDSVETEPIDVNAVLAREIPNQLAYFSFVDTTVFSTGSFGQVYRARLVDGRDVIIKILRPSVAKHLASDHKNIGRVVRLMNMIAPATVFDIKDTFREFVRITIDETDYIRECASARWFYDYFKHDNNIVIPQTFPEMSTGSVLVQEFIGGITLADAMRAQQHGVDIEKFVHEQTGSNLWKQIENIGTAWTISAFKANYVVGDPHPGNIKLLANNKVGLIDFGIVADAPINRNAFLGFMREYKSFYNGDLSLGSFAISALIFYDDRLAQALSVVGSNMLGSEFRTIFESAAEEIFSKYSTEDRVQGFLKRRQMSQLFDRVINAGNRFNIRINTENLALLRAMLALISTSSLISERAHTTKHFDVYRRIFTNSVDEIDRTGIASSRAHTPLSDGQAAELFADWLGTVADRDPFLYQSLTGSMN